MRKIENKERFITMSDSKVKVERINPDTVYGSQALSKMMTVEGGKLVQTSGMTAMDLEWNLVGKGDLKVQAAKVYENIRLTLEAIGATPADVIMQRLYVVDLKPDDRPIVQEAMKNFYGDGLRPNSALVGVSGLAMEGMLIEIDVTAAIDA
jgi:enamine deaminase RidA (YjgF/YER057c/UK114 family)